MGIKIICSKYKKCIITQICVVIFYMCMCDKHIVQIHILKKLKMYGKSVFDLSVRNV